MEFWIFPLLYFLGNTRRPTAKYTKVGERLRHVIPGHMACSMACGGRACKYENPARWSEQEQAIKGVYSSWWVILPGFGSSPLQLDRTREWRCMWCRDAAGCGRGTLGCEVMTSPPVSGLATWRAVSHSHRRSEPLFSHVWNNKTNPIGSFLN